MLSLSMAFSATLFPSAGSHFSYLAFQSSPRVRSSHERRVEDSPCPEEGQEDLQTTGQSDTGDPGVTAGGDRGGLVVDLVC